MNYAAHRAELAQREARATQVKIDELQRDIARLEFAAREQAAQPPKMTDDRRRDLLQMMGVRDTEAPGTV